MLDRYLQNYLENKQVEKFEKTANSRFHPPSHKKILPARISLVPVFDALSAKKPYWKALHKNDGETEKKLCTAFW